MKKNMKNWMSLMAIGSLITGCGALKHPSATTNNNTENPVQVPVTANPNIAETHFPNVVLNNLSTTPGTWTSPSGKKFEVVGKIDKQESHSLLGSDEESVKIVGNLSITLQTKSYQALYNDDQFLPTSSQNNEDHPEVAVYFGQAEDAPETTMILILEQDFQALMSRNALVTVSYSVKLVCSQWNVQAPADPLHFFQNSCQDQNSVITCTSFGNCASSCDVGNAIAALYPINYSQSMLDQANSPNCIQHVQWPTESVPMMNTAKISEFRIHPTDPTLKASLVTFAGEQL